jgi:LPXTG-motif cell wall-anchored protein
MVGLTPKRLQQDRRFTQQVVSPDPGAANNLFTFLAQRLSASFGNLGCDKLTKGGDPVKVTVRNGVAVDASFVGLGTGNRGTGKGGAGKGGTPTPSRGTPGSGAGNGGKKGASPSATPTATATPSGATVKDAFTPTASPQSTSARTTTSHTPDTRVSSRRTADATVRVTAKPARTVAPEATARHTRAGGAAATRASKAAISTDDGVVNSGTRAPVVAAGYQDRPTANDVPVAKNTGVLARTGANSIVLIAGGVVLILVATAIIALTRRRRPQGTYY